MHQKATTVVLGAKLRDIGGNFDYTGKPYWPHPGAKFGHFVSDVEAKLCYGYGRSC